MSESKMILGHLGNCCVIEKCCLCGKIPACVCLEHCLLVLAKDKLITMQGLFSLDLLVCMDRESREVGFNTTLQNCFCRGSHTILGEASMQQSTFRTRAIRR